MNLTQAKRLGLDLMAQHGLISNGWKLRFDSAVRRLGYCRYNTKTISLSRELTALNPESQVTNTILHEIAHALVGAGYGHGEAWRRKAIAIGCNGERCTASLIRVDPKYNVVCGLCLKSLGGYHRKPRNLATSYHKQCGRGSIGRLQVLEVSNP